MSTWTTLFSLFTRRLNILRRAPIMNVETSTALKRDADAEIDPHSEDTKRTRLNEDADAAHAVNEATSSTDPVPSRSKRKKGKSKNAPYDKRRGTRPEAGVAVENGEEKIPRLPKRLHALLIGYAGSGFNGMQM